MGTGRITIPVLKVLSVFLSQPSHDHYGLEVARASGLPSGTVYPILARLERAGWLTSDWENIDEAAEGRRRRRYYRLTTRGRAEASRVLDEANRVATVPVALLPVPRPPPVGKVFS
ncbi:MAG: helix-turn-helix transcriptional regulator [Egibacteraceae bacterium]